MPKRVTVTVKKIIAATLQFKSVFCYLVKSKWMLIWPSISKSYSCFLGLFEFFFFIVINTYTHWKWLGIRQAFHPAPSTPWRSFESIKLISLKQLTFSHTVEITVYANLRSWFNKNLDAKQVVALSDWNSK